MKVLEVNEVADGAGQAPSGVTWHDPCDSDSCAAPQTVAALFVEFGQGIYNYACRLMADRSEAEDVAQEVFLKAQLRLAAGPPLQHARAWLYKVASHTCIDRLRKRGREVATEIDEGDRPALVDEFAHAELGALVEASLRRLQPRQREALILRDLQGLHYDEICFVLGATVGASQALVSRARESFQREFTRLALGASPTDNAERPTCASLLGLAPVLALPTSLQALPGLLSGGAAAAAAGTAAHSASTGLLAKVLGSAAAKLVTTGVVVGTVVVGVGGGALIIRDVNEHHRAPVAGLVRAASARAKATTTSRSLAEQPSVLGVDILRRASTAQHRKDAQGTQQNGQSGSSGQSGRDGPGQTYGSAATSSGQQGGNSSADQGSGSSNPQGSQPSAPGGAGSDQQGAAPSRATSTSSGDGSFNQPGSQN
jgi:RNA polymerase sigma-70 factor (ECF subfamily)